MDDLEDLVEKGDGINFIPCVKWVKRGAAKSQPEKVKLTQEELAKIISKTQTNLTEVESGEHPENGSTTKNEPDSETEEGDADATMDITAENDDDDFEKRYNMDAYDDEDDDNTAGLGIGNLMAHANQRDDKYLRDPDEDDDQSDI